MISAVRMLSVPTMIRSGIRQSSTAVPSLRNSGLETTSKSWLVAARIASRTRSQVPTGTVLLTTTTL